MLAHLNSQAAVLSIALSFLVAVVVRSVIGRRRANPNGLPFPPGPKSRPIIGNLFDLPTKRPWQTYTAWGKEYHSDILHVSAMGQHIFILNSLEDTTELLDKRSHLYSDRPYIPMVEFTGWGWNSSLLSYGDTWRRHRRGLQQGFRKQAAHSYHPIHTRKVHQMLNHLISTPELFASHIRTLSGAIIMEIVYDHQVAPNDRFVAMMERAAVILTEGVLPGASAINVFPFLQRLPEWFPGIGYKREAMECRELTYTMRHELYEFVQRNRNSSAGSLSLLADLLDSSDSRRGSEEDHDILKSVAAMAFAAGADTTVAALATFFYAMTIYPDFQLKAQEEIDRVIGNDRLPAYDDRASLPYVEAVVREVLRWRPVLPLAVPHAVIADDTYKGYHIPKGHLRVIPLGWEASLILTYIGSVVIGNVWAIMHDERVYPNPERFTPERFLNEDGELNGLDVSAVFGFGRRICPGRHTGDATVWLGVACVLATFNLAKAKDAVGKEIEIVEDYSDGAVSHPHPFQCSITVRSKDAQKLIEEAATASK